MFSCQVKEKRTHITSISAPALLRGKEIPCIIVSLGSLIMHTLILSSVRHMARHAKMFINKLDSHIFKSTQEEKNKAGGVHEANSDTQARLFCIHITLALHPPHSSLSFSCLLEWICERKKKKSPCHAHDEQGLLNESLNKPLSSLFSFILHLQWVGYQDTFQTYKEKKTFVMMMLSGNSENRKKATDNSFSG